MPTEGNIPHSREKPSFSPAHRYRSSNVSWKSNEILELKNRFRDPSLDAMDEENGRTELIKKVISLTTSGIDTSSLFPEMLLAGATGSLIEKKMVYLYIGMYAGANQELALLCINTFQKDCADESPIIRGLALRCFSGLRLPYLSEYILPLVETCYSDRSAYVRRIAIMSSLELSVCHDSLRTRDTREIIDKMVYDADSGVCINAITTLGHFERGTSMERQKVPLGLLVPPSITKSMVYFLLNRLREMSDWEISTVLWRTANYEVTDEQEMYDIMNLLEESIKTLNSALLISVSNFFIRLARKDETLLFHVCNRLRKPLLLMCSYSSPEILYILLMHLKFLVHLSPQSFHESYRGFFPRLGEPSYIKSTKIDVLVKLLTEKNVGSILDEITYCIKESRENHDIVSKCARSIDGVCDFLLVNRGVLKADLFDAISGKLHTFHRRLLDHPYDDFAREMSIRSLPKILSLGNVDDGTFIRSFISINEVKKLDLSSRDTVFSILYTLRNFPQSIAQAPYILELIIGMHSILSYELRDNLLRTSIMLFAKRPSETLKALRNLLVIEMNDFSNADIRDRALMYHRALSKGVLYAESIARGAYSCQEKMIRCQCADTTTKSMDILFDEFNSISIILNKPIAWQAARS
ncbi:hypothetical protein XU18_0015 [Perkinsela sp. CCAP 1560/4]|nr:hypothetical protein XU18_0015 [Perkinsela sp. CCAP 1560/4]|eukprot:KNH09330.1 hypothetical protein XU18_0015 [Perkinsela sp. CCAP 1560/4]